MDNPENDAFIKEYRAHRRHYLLRSLVFVWQEWRCKRARQYLLTHDADWRGTYVGIELVNRREKLYANGVRPDSREIPDRWDVDLELPKMAWPHGDYLSFLRKVKKYKDEKT